MLVIAESVLIYLWCPQIPYDTMTPLQAAVGVRQVGKKHYLLCRTIMHCETC